MFLIIWLLFISKVKSFPGQDDEIINLPGLTFKLNFKQYSGYLNGSTEVKLHYWLVESQSSPEKDPLVLWLNGGPGCSSLFGLLKENGPFKVTSEKSLISNPYSWNKIANMIYLESPAFVGFSYSVNGKYNATDDSTSLLNFNALQHFFVKFPQYKNREFYISGESYAGFYIPTLSEIIVKIKNILPVQFKGIAIGNALSSRIINNNGALNFAYNHALISDSVWSGILSACCQSKKPNQCDIINNPDPFCQFLLKKAVGGIGHLNPYNIYDSCYLPSSTVDDIWTHLEVYSSFEKSQILLNWNSNSDHRLNNLRKKFIFLNSVKYNNREKTGNQPILPCTDSRDLINYLNQLQVRSALHIPAFVIPFVDCSSSVMLNYTSNYENMTNQYNVLFSLKNFKIWIYNGDVDMVCSYLGEEWYFENLGVKVASQRRPWLFNDTDGSSQIGGYVKVYEKFVLITVRGSGHMVPADKPLPAYRIFEAFIKGKSL